MFGVGIDLLEIDRLEAVLVRRPTLAERVFTSLERGYAATTARPAQHLAARFCAKEAVAKALGLQGWCFRDVEVCSIATSPEIQLRGRAAQRAHELGVTVQISLTHTRTTAGAVAVALPSQLVAPPNHPALQAQRAHSLKPKQLFAPKSQEPFREA